MTSWAKNPPINKVKTPPAQVGGHCRPHGCPPPPPPKPNPLTTFAKGKQGQEERARVQRRQPDGRYMSQNDLRAEAQMLDARNKREAYYNAMRPIQGDRPLRAVDPITNTKTSMDSPATSANFESTNYDSGGWLRKKRLRKIRRKHKDDRLPFEV